VNLPAALRTELPLFKRDGGFVRAGYEAALDGRATCATPRASWWPRCRLAADDTGIKGLKIRHNNVLGYFRRGHGATR
jgi:DNA mismatch repair protein MutS